VIGTLKIPAILHKVPICNDAFMQPPSQAQPQSVPRGPAEGVPKTVSKPRADVGLRIFKKFKLSQKFKLSEF
jgi:hypothetical protein